MTVMQSIITVAAVVAGTVVTRFLPFIVFPEGRKPPEYILYLGRVLPYAVIGMLIVYCLKDAVFTPYHGLPEIIGIGGTVVVHLWKKNTLFSIAAGTIIYMLLVQNIFV